MIQGNEGSCLETQDNNKNSQTHSMTQTYNT